MEKETVIAKLRGAIDFTDEARLWVGRYRADSWIAKQQGQVFLSEFSGTWKRLFIETAEPDIRSYFQKLGVPQQHLPSVRISESYGGSWIVDAYITIAGTVGTTFLVLKGVSEIPKIVDGLLELKNRIKGNFARRANDAATALLVEAERLVAGPPPPVRLLAVDFVIDARPLSALASEPLESHKIHLSAAVSRHTFALENLGDEPLENLRIGLFKSATQKNEWLYEQSYTGSVPCPSGRQTIAKDLAEFRDAAGNELDLSAAGSIHVDCWVQDQHGIHLFMFLLG